MKLKDALPGKLLEVKSIDLDEPSQIRLQALGMIPSTNISIVRKKKSGTMVILIRGTRFALGSAMSECIEVAYA